MASIPTGMVVSPFHDDTAVNSAKGESVGKRAICGQRFSLRAHKMQVWIDRMVQIPIGRSDPAVQLQNAGNQLNQSGRTETMSGQRLGGIDQKISGFFLKDGMNCRALCTVSQ